MARIVMLQFCVAFIIATIAIPLIGQSAALSALFGGLSCAIPNALFALSLYAKTKKPGGATPTTFFVGEFLKLLTTTTLLAAVVLFYRDLHWFMFIGSFIAVLKSYFILLLRS